MRDNTSRKRTEERVRQLTQRLKILSEKSGAEAEPRAEAVSPPMQRPDQAVMAVLERLQSAVAAIARGAEAGSAGVRILDPNPEH